MTKADPKIAVTLKLLARSCVRTGDAIDCTRISEPRSQIAALAAIEGLLVQLAQMQADLSQYIKN